MQSDKLVPTPTLYRPAYVVVKMALLKLDNNILLIRGRFGGVYFKKDRYGQHVQAWPRVISYTRSEAQIGAFGHFSPFESSGISGYSGAADLWVLALIAFFGATWAAYAMYNLFTTNTGEKKRISGYNWYIYYALAFPEEERPPFWKPPHSPGELPQCIVLLKGREAYKTGPPGREDYDPTEYYWFDGWYGDYPTFTSDDKEHYLWFNGSNWVLSKAVGNQDPNYAFISDGSEIFDYYRNSVHNKWSHVYQGGGEFPD